MCCSALTDEQSSETRTRNGGVPATMWEFFCPRYLQAFNWKFEMWDMKGAA